MSTKTQSKSKKSKRGDYDYIVGLWSRQRFNGVPEENGPYVLFFANKMYWAQNPGGDPIHGEVIQFHELPQPHKGTFATRNQHNQVVPWNYALDQNNEFKSLYAPRPGYPHPPKLNEMRLWKPGTDQLLAFIAHFRFTPGPGPGPLPDTDFRIDDPFINQFLSE